MAEELLKFVVILSGALVAWHHVGWPLLLARLARRAPPCAPARLRDDDLPAVTIVMPAFNEQAHIAAKLLNLSQIDYPRELLCVVLACDGCTDATVAEARSALLQDWAVGLRVEVRDIAANRGKVAVLNETIAGITDGLIALTDVSAMLPPDALRIAAAHYTNSKVGAVGGTYRLEAAGAPGEAVYWRYQVAVKRGEAALGAPLGMHGAFWTFRRSAWSALMADTINDDFILPLEIFGRGWELRYDESIVALEAEASGSGMDRSRRRRIAAGNAQQLARLSWLLHPRHGGVALAFWSGKALRVTMPFLILAWIAGTIVLAAHSWMFAAISLAQCAGLVLAIAGGLLGARAPRILAVGNYALMGHVASGMGVARYLLRRERQPWGRVERLT